MNILLIALGIITVFTIVVLLIYAFVAKKTWMSVTIGVIIVITVGILILTNVNLKSKEKSSTSTTQQQPRNNRVVSAIFTLPADGSIISHDEKGQKASYKEGQYVRFDQLTATGKYLCANNDGPSWSTQRRSCVSGPASADGFVMLASSSGRKMRIKVKVFNK